MIRNLAIVFCLLVYWNISCHGEEEGEGGKTTSLKEKEGLSCKDVNPDTVILKKEISVYTVKENSTGDWVTTFQADRDLDNSTAAVNLMLTQELVRCGEDKRMVLRITGVMRDIDGKQLASKKQNTSIPDLKEEKEDMIVNGGANKRGTWSSLYSYIYLNGSSRKLYSLNLVDIPDGTVLGITRKSNGDVHFFINGLDMGKAFEGVPKGVYAFFEIINYVTQISVVHDKCFN